MRRGDPAPALAAAPHRLSGELFMNGQEHFYLETQAALAWVDESDSLFVQSSTQHPSETQEIVARVLGVRAARGGGAVPAHGRRLRRQGGAGQRLGGGGGAGRAQAAAAGARAPDPRAGHGDDRQAPSLPGALRRRLRRRRQAAGRWRCSCSATAAGAWISARRCWAARCFTPTTATSCPTSRSRGASAAPTMSRTPPFAASVGRRGWWSIEEILDRIARTLDLPPHAVRERNFYAAGDTTHYGQEVRDADRIRRIWTELRRSGELRRSAGRRSRASTQLSAHRKRGLAHHAGEVRHLVHDGVLTTRPARWC